jgi:hypothetical protein
MPRATAVQVCIYRDHRLELRDDGGTGWTVAIYAPCGRNAPLEVLRNSVPNGLATLLAAVRWQVDRRLDGGPGDAW